MKERKAIIIIIIIYVILSIVCMSHAGDDREIDSYGYGSVVLDDTIVINNETYVEQIFKVIQKSRGIEVLLQSYSLTENQEIIFDFYELKGEKHIATKEVYLDGAGENFYLRVLLDDFYFENGKRYFFTIELNGNEDDYLAIYKGQNVSAYEDNLYVEGRWSIDKAMIYNLLYEKENPYFILWIFMMIISHMIILLYKINHTSKIRVKIESMFVIIFNCFCFVYWWKCY